MKKLLVFVLIASTPFLLAGCFWSKPAVPTAIAPLATSTATDNGSGAPQTTAPRFYPDNTAINPGQSAPATADPERNFTITQERQVKMYLVDKYSPGVCYGMPDAVPEVAISGMINQDPQWAKFLQERYGLKTDLDVYNKIKQLNGIRLTTLAGGKYQFNFVDGQCCTLHAYEGEITIMGRTISDTVTREETKQNPC